MQISIQKDGSGYLATVGWNENIFAYGESQDTAKKELLGVVEMMLEYHKEQVKWEEKVRDYLLSTIQ